MIRRNRSSFFSFGFSAALWVSALALGGCSGSQSPTPVTLTSIAVTPANANLALGNNQAFTATGMFSDGTMKDLTLTVTWSSSATTVVTIFALKPRFAFIANAGDDTISTFTVDAGTGQLRSSGYHLAGPRPKSLRLHPNGKFIYAGNGGTNAVSAYSVGSDGRLREVAGSPFSTSELFTVLDVEFHPSGNFLYAADGKVLVFRVDATTGALAEITGSPFSTGGVVIATVADPTGKFLYAVDNRNNSVSAFTIDGATGALTSLGTPVAVGPSPNDITMDPAGKFVYVANTGVDTISAFSQDAVTGALMPVPGSPFPTSQMPIHLSTDPGGKFLFVANSFDTKVNMFAIDPVTGALTKTADGNTTFCVFYVEADT